LLDTLDANRDGQLSLDELDRDHDGVLRGSECRYVRLVEIRWRAEPEGFWRVIALHPRWRILRDSSREENFQTSYFTP
jgi:hypothetical protein